MLRLAAHQSEVLKFASVMGYTKESSVICLNVQIRMNLNMMSIIIILLDFENFVNRYEGENSSKLQRLFAVGCDNKANLAQF